MKTPFAVIFAAGFASSTAQIMLLRELIVFFYGNELSTGLILTCWLTWTALGSLLGSGLSRRFTTSSFLLGSVLSLQGCLLPASILFIRASRWIWSIPPGEMFPFGTMLAVTTLATLLLCVPGGLLFALAWDFAFHGSSSEHGRPLWVYAGEALGSAAGGLCVHYLVLPRWDAADAAFWIAGILVGTGSACMGPALDSRRSLRAVLRLGGLGAALALAAVPYATPVSFTSHRWQWGDHLIAVRSTPFHQLALLEDSNQFTLFGNGLWYFTIPDPQTAETAVHLGLLQHPAPGRILLVGGGVGGLLRETLKHPSVRHIDHVEIDPEILHLVREYAPLPEDPLSDERIRTYHQDGGTFIRKTGELYDVVMLNMGEPVNAELNRFYTQEFYQRIRSIMSRGALLSFGLPSAPEAVGESQLRYLKSIHATLSATFPDVLVVPGEAVRFVASPTLGTLSEDPALLVARKNERGLDLQYVQDYMLMDLFNPLRMDTLRSLLKAAEGSPVNRDFSPVCYFNGLRVWASQLHPVAERILTFADRNLGRPSWSHAAGMLLILLLVFFFCTRTLTGPILISAAVTGGSLLTLEIVLLLAFQILEGYLYGELAMIISCTMTGIAVGAVFIEPLVGRGRRMNRWLIAVQFVLAFFFMSVLVGLHLTHESGAVSGCPSWRNIIFFRGMALTGGILGGLHFSLASAVWAGDSGLEARVGARLYGADLAGAALGALTSTLLLLPLHGLLVTLGIFGILLLYSGALLMLRPGWR
jgi:spermidine synthase